MTSEMQEYVELLKRHDWSYQFSGDAGVWKRGAAQRAKLMGMQHALDPDYEVWNLHARGDEYHVPRLVG